MAEQGSGTVLAIAIIAVLMLLLGLVVLLSSVAAAKVEATRAADLAALAAADTARGLHQGDPCSVAAEVTAANDLSLSDCSIGGEYETEVHVTVQAPIDIPGIAARLNMPELHAEHTSRAGPPEALTSD